MIGSPWAAGSPDWDWCRGRGVSSYQQLHWLWWLGYEHTPLSKTSHLQLSHLLLKKSVAQETMNGCKKVAAEYRQTASVQFVQIFGRIKFKRNNLMQWQEIINKNREKVIRLLSWHVSYLLLDIIGSLSQRLYKCQRMDSSSWNIRSFYCRLSPLGLSTAAHHLALFCFHSPSVPQWSESMSI